MTYPNSEPVDGEEVVWEQHFAVPTSHDEGADICRLAGWVEHGGAHVHVVLLSTCASLGLCGDLADTQRKADLVSNWSWDVGLARNEVFPFLVHFEGVAVAEDLVAHTAHTDDVDALAVTELAVVPFVVPVSIAVMCA
jgi:hypothetical protein